ncbi:phage tail protein [Vibrio jasicida]|uniref:phage tail protein n=1 Tax=Vibrio jasicida TaxID=766224 RepID=UPI0005ED91E1|nr:phage tail protein [Vibrio jasicida]
MTEPVIRKSYMQQLAEVYFALLTKKLGKTGVDKFDAVLFDVTLTPSFKLDGNGMTVAHMDYTAEFEFEQIPSRMLSAQVLISQTMCWLYENVPSKQSVELGKPKVDSDAYSNDGENISDVTITIKFREPVNMRVAQENDDGDVFFKGQWWVCEDFDVWTAETLTVIGKTCGVGI